MSIEPDMRFPMKPASPPPQCKVYTPRPLATAIVCALGDADGAWWLEPSHGKGVFVEAIGALGVDKERIVAIDLDRTSSSADCLATTFRGVDFLRWAADTDRRFDRIVGNPPFISISKLPAILQGPAASVLDLGDRAIGKGANLWYSFVLASLRLLRRGGCIAFVLPSATEFADYSAEMRRGIAACFGSLELYHCARPLFDEVQEGTLIAVARSYGSGPGQILRRRFATRASLIKGLSQSGRSNGHKCPAGPPRRNGGTVMLSSVAKIGVGGVTGDAGFFLMNEEKRARLGLPVRAMSPVVSKARHLRNASLTVNRWESLKSTGERVWLFDPPDSMLVHPNVEHYLNADRADGGCNRQAYKLTVRDPWYRTPMPAIPDAFLSGMSRHGPWMCINETKSVNATNTLYVVRFTSRARNDWYMWALALLTSDVQRQIRRIGRRYPEGLVKHEPGALGNISLPRLVPRADYQRRFRKAISALLAGNAAAAREIADSALPRS